MGASKALTPEAKLGFALDPTLAAALEQALAAALKNFDTPRNIAVALSGGVDSAMLAVHAAAWRQSQSPDVQVYCLHIHHGLQTAAGQWRDQAKALTEQLNLNWQERQVDVDFSRGDGLESAARTARYDALIALSQPLNIHTVLLAHHQDDQAETVLLRLLRGAGPEGLAAMRPCVERSNILFVRPWLIVPRARILAQAENYAQHHTWQAVQDPSNLQDAYTRGALRTRLAPHLNKRWPGWQAVLARHARQSAQVAELLTEVATQDFSTLEPDADNLSFSLQKWRQLSAARQTQVLRYWLAQMGTRMPSDARLRELMRQMRQLHALGHDRQLQLDHDGGQIRCVRGRMQWLPAGTSRQTR